MKNKYLAKTDIPEEIQTVVGMVPGYFYLVYLPKTRETCIIDELGPVYFYRTAPDLVEFYG